MSNFANITEQEYFLLRNLRNQMTMMQNLLAYHTQGKSLHVSAEQLESFLDIQASLLSQVTDALTSRSDAAVQRMSPEHWAQLIQALRAQDIGRDAEASITARLMTETMLDAKMAPVMAAWRSLTTTNRSPAPASMPRTRNRAKLAAQSA